MTFDEAIELARERRIVGGQHQAVIQRGGNLRVVELRGRQYPRTAWTTQDDCRHIEIKRRNEYRKVAKDDIHLIVALGADGMSPTEIARKFEVARTTVRRLLRAA